MAQNELSQEELDKTYEDIEQMLHIMEEIYFKNLEYFKSTDKELYKVIKKESKKISKNKSKEKFAVELNKKGSLDIINRKDGKYFYNTDPFLRGDNIAKQLVYKTIAFKGIGLGTHISSAIKFNKPKKVLICEENIQIFRCAMYITDFTELSNLTKLKVNLGETCKDKKYDKVFKIK